MRQFKVSESSYTLRNDNIGRYIAEVNETPLLTPEEEFEIALEAQRGDREAINRLVKANLRFVISVAKMYGGRNINMFGDLINEGNLGLVEAAESFDPTTGFKFISYAVWHIRKNMTKYLTVNARTVRLPQNKVTAIHQMREIESDLANELDRMPTVDEVVEKFMETSPSMKNIQNVEKTSEGIREALQSNSKAVSLYGEGTDDDEKDFKPINYINGDSDGTDHLANKSDELLVIQRMVSKLGSRERDLIIKRFGLFGTDPISRSIYAELYGVSVESVRNWEKKTMKKLSIIARSMGINEFTLS